MNSITKQEIENQFKTWPQLDIVLNNSNELIESTLSKLEDDWVVVFTGAGTSGYIGDYLENILNRYVEKINFKSIYSTEIVGNPELFLKNKKILLISFARSGNSPESCEAVKLASMYSSKCEHLIITCNPEGNLAKKYPDNTIFIPEVANDKGFAMTNSFSSMLIMAAKIFDIKLNTDNLVYEANRIYQNFPYESILNLEFENIIFLSNSENLGLLNELKLKFVELSNGKYGYYNEHFLNFRHGPKSLITKKSLIFIINSKDEVTQKYEHDLITELSTDKNKPYIVCFGECDSNADLNICVNGDSELKALGILPCMQKLAVLISEKNGFNPDNPSPDGSVNRVVQGVNIYERTLC